MLDQTRGTVISSQVVSNLTEGGEPTKALHGEWLWLDFVNGVAVASVVWHLSRPIGLEA